MHFYSFQTTEIEGGGLRIQSELLWFGFVSWKIKEKERMKCVWLTVKTIG